MATDVSLVLHRRWKPLHQGARGQGGEGGPATVMPLQEDSRLAAPLASSEATQQKLWAVLSSANTSRRTQRLAVRMGSCKGRH